MSLARSLWIALTSLALIAAFALVRYAPPAPRPPEPGRFSAVRAHEVHARLSAFPTRTIGTEGNERGRALIRSELEALGFKVETQSALSCTSYGVCAPVTNILASRQGRKRLSRMAT